MHGRAAAADREALAKLGDPLPPSGGSSGGTASSGLGGITPSGSTGIASAGRSQSVPVPMPTGPGTVPNFNSPTMPPPQTMQQQSPGSPMPPPASTSSNATPSTSSHGDVGPTSPQSPAPAAAPGTEGTVINSGICAGEGPAQKCTQVTKYCTGEGAAQQCTQVTQYCSGGTCTTTPQPGFPPAPGSQASAPPPNPDTLKLKLNPQNPTQMANVDSQPSNQNNPSVQACESKPPYLPWGGTGSATITVSGGKPCGIGWHDTGATIFDSMSVTSPPSHGTLTPKDQHVIIFTPAPGYKGQDSFTLSMQEHNSGRRATLRVKVSVTIQ